MKSVLLKLIHRILASSAHRVINRFDPFVIAVTGSVGKSSTKEAIHRVLAEAFGPPSVRASAGNLNSEIGVPLTILGYKKVPGKLLWPFFLVGFTIRSFLTRGYPKYLILELGVDKPGDMNYLTAIFQPKIAVFTALTKAHLANFASHDEYANEKLRLRSAVASGGMIIVNADDKRLARIEAENVIRVGIENKDVGYRAESVNLSLGGTEYRVSMTGRKIAVKSSLLGKQLVYPQLFALAIADFLGVSLLKAAKVFEEMEPMPGRMRLIEGKDGTTIIDDTYNASPASVRAALDFLAEAPHRARKVAIIGNMNELGDHSEVAHKEIANYAKERCDLAVFVGPYSQMMASQFGGMGQALAFETRAELTTHLGSTIQRNDLILIKASQNKNFFEEIVKSLMKSPGLAEKMLVRHGIDWQRKKQ